MLPEWLTDECKLVVLDKFEFENLEVNIINFFISALHKSWTEKT